MSKQTYLSVKNLPVRPFTTQTIAIVACAKAFDVNTVVWAVLITILAIIWIILFVAMFNSNDVDLDIESLAKDYPKRS